MKLYHVSKSRSVRVLWLLEELGLDYTLEKLSFDPKALKTQDYLEINPFGQVPVLVDGPLTMSESVAIVQYILQRYGDDRLEPPRDSVEYGKFMQWLHFGESTMMGPVAEILLHSRFLPEEQRIPAAVARGQRTLRHYCDVLAKELSAKPWLVGQEFTAADIVVGYDFFALDLFGLLPELPPALAAWYQRLRERPAFQKATA